MADEMKRRRLIAAEAFAARRDELRLTQEQVAARAGIVAKTVYNFESGRWPNSRTRRRLELAVDWPPGAIERLAEEPEPELDPRLVELASRLTDAEKEALVRLLRQPRDEGSGQQAACG
jgi:transcriptional regulator with XRE-family HTH domain